MLLSDLTPTSGLPHQPRSPLYLTEILESVFALLSQSKLRSVSLVCRQWRQVALRLLDFSFHWHGLQTTKDEEGYAKELEQTRRKLNLAQILICGNANNDRHYRSVERWPLHHTPTEDQNPETVAGWNAALELVEKVVQDFGPLKAQQLKLFLGLNNWDFGVGLFPILDDSNRLAKTNPCGLLRELEIETEAGYYSLPLQRILEGCPRLLRLTLRATSTAVETQLDRYRAPPTVPASTTEGDDGLSLLQTWPLKSLTLEGLAIKATQLQLYFPRLAHLTEFRLVCAYPGPTEGPTTLVLSTVTQRRFFQELALHCPNIDSLHYSQHKLAMNSSQYDKDSGVYRIAFGLFPLVRSWGLSFDRFAVRDPSATLVRHLTTQPSLVENRITSLEIVPGTWPLLSAYWDSSECLRGRYHLPIRQHDEGVRVLNLFLRDSPQLLHFKAKGIPIYFLREIHVWGCRRLETLWIQYRHMYAMNRSEHHGYVPTRYRKGLDGREVFGYLSRICPRLKELDVDFAGEDEYSKCGGRGDILNLRAGLCLLTRCQFLERLRIRLYLEECSDFDPLLTTSLDKEDVAWMLPLSLPLPPYCSSTPPPSTSTTGIVTEKVSQLLGYMTTTSELRSRLTRLQESLNKIQSEDYYGCLTELPWSSCYNRRQYYRARRAREASSAFSFTGLAWYTIKMTEFWLSEEPKSAYKHWRAPQERRNQSLQILAPCQKSKFWTDYDRPKVEGNAWPLVDGLNQDAIGKTADVEARILALIEVQEYVIRKSREPQGGKLGDFEDHGHTTQTSAQNWKACGTVGEITIADGHPWSKMEEFKIVYELNAKGLTDKEVVLQEQTRKVQKFFQETRPDISVQVSVDRVWKR
ncbi:hypothetical protein BGZ83_011530 [Gryganskiella cystojenkinii]|nr:hypothetical protein BGZ83_011530 [Gryganskiella cystojenkinii]